MTRAYLRLDPSFDERKEHYPDGPYAALIAVFCLAETQPQRGRFRSADYLRRLLGKRGRHVAYLLAHGDLTELEDGRLYVDGWDEWQEGDWKVSERVGRIRNRVRRNGGCNGGGNATGNGDSNAGGNGDSNAGGNGSPQDGRRSGKQSVAVGVAADRAPAKTNGSFDQEERKRQPTVEERQRELRAELDLPDLSGERRSLIETQLRAWKEHHVA